MGGQNNKKDDKKVTKKNDKDKDKRLRTISVAHMAREHLRNTMDAIKRSRDQLKALGVLETVDKMTETLKVMNELKKSYSADIRSITHGYIPRHDPATPPTKTATPPSLSSPDSHPDTRSSTDTAPSPPQGLQVAVFDGGDGGALDPNDALTELDLDSESDGPSDGPSDDFEDDALDNVDNHGRRRRRRRVLFVCEEESETDSNSENVN